MVTVAIEDRFPIVRAVGDAARIPEKISQLLNGNFDTADLDARLVQPYYTRRLAQQLGYALRFAANGNKITLEAGLPDKAE
jgi:histidine phosphotransferase ChpT